MLFAALGLLVVLLCVVAPANAQSGAQDDIPVGVTIEPYVVITGPTGGNELPDIWMQEVTADWFAHPGSHHQSNGSVNLDFFCNVPVLVHCPGVVTLTNFTNSDHVSVDVDASIGELGGTPPGDYATQDNDGNWTMWFGPGLNQHIAFIQVSLNALWDVSVHKEGTYHGVLDLQLAPVLD
jgi:hypothetical protein